MRIKAFQSIVYLQIRRGWLSVRVLTWSGGDFRWEGRAEAFLTHERNGRPAILESAAARSNPNLVGGFFTAFSHPRAFIDGFDETRLLLQFFTRQSGYKTRSKKLIFVVHLRDRWEGGLSDVETKALTEICKQSGASEIRIIDEPMELAPPQILELVRSSG